MKAAALRKYRRQSILKWTSAGAFGSLVFDTLLDGLEGKMDSFWRYALTFLIGGVVGIILELWTRKEREAKKLNK